MSDTEQPHDTVRRKPLARRVLDRTLLVALALGIVLAVKEFGLDVGVVEGESMRPTLKPDDRVLVEKVTPRLGRLSRGDIVMVRAPDDNGLLVKRLVGLPGDDLASWSGTLFVNGRPEDEPQGVQRFCYEFRPTRLGTDQVFVLGDNRMSSEDSTTWGPLRQEDIIARVISRPWRWRGPVAALPRLLARVRDGEERTQ